MYTHPRVSLLPSTRASASQVGSTRRSELPPPHCGRFHAHPAKKGHRSPRARLQPVHPTHGAAASHHSWLQDGHPTLPARTAQQPPRAVILWNKDSPAHLSVWVAPANVTALTGDLGGSSTCSSRQNPLQRGCRHTPILCAQGLLSKTRGQSHLFFIFCLLSAPPLGIPRVWTTFCEIVKRGRGSCHLGKPVADYI